MEMTQKEKQAYEWALKQNYESVAARNARLLAKYIERNLAVEHSVEPTECTECGSPLPEHFANCERQPA